MINTEKYELLLREKITPRYVVGRDTPDAYFLHGNDIKKHVENCKEIMIFAATLGLQVDGLIRSLEASDMPGAVITDSLASDMIENYCDDVFRGRTDLTTRFSPGYGDFPLEVQHELLRILDAKKQIGLYATAGGLLIPRKSITAIIGVM